MTTYSYCVECGTFQEPEDQFCKNCGQSNNHFEILNNNAIHCPSCAIPIASDFKYCPACGSRTEIPGTVKHISEAEKKGKSIKEINEVTDILKGKHLPDNEGQNLW